MSSESLLRSLALLVSGIGTSCSSPPRPPVTPAAASVVRPAPPVPREPTAAGSIETVVAIDPERAIVRFVESGPQTRRWWLASIRRDGRVQWARQLGSWLGRSGGSPGIAIVGDVVSAFTSDPSSTHALLTLQGFALADGSPRFVEPVAPGPATRTLTDGTRRFDTRANELVASAATGILWRAELPPAPPPGHDPTLVGEWIAVRTREPDPGRSTFDEGPDDEVVWMVFERATGRLVGRLPSLPQSCSDGRRWLVLTRSGLVEVDPRTLATRVVLADAVLPGEGRWIVQDCSFAGQTPVVLARRGHRRALLALDPATLSVQRHVVLAGVAAVGGLDDSDGYDGFDPLPPRLHRAVALMTLRNDGEEEIVVADPIGGRMLGRWEGTNAYIWAAMTIWSRGTIVVTRHTVSTLDGSGGELAGRALADDIAIEPWQIADDTLWLPPAGNLHLGRRAPTIVDLDADVAPAIHDAVLADLADPARALPPGHRPPCPDAGAVVRGDGLGVTDGTLAPVARTRSPRWDLDVLHETARTYACAPGSAVSRLLAWYVMEDDRPLRNDNALVLVEDVTGGRPVYTLVQMYRHAVNSDWNVAASFHSPSEPVRAYDHRPTRAEIDEFLAQSGWTFTDDWGRVIAGNVLDAEWRAATGQRPWRSFARGIERPD